MHISKYFHQQLAQQFKSQIWSVSFWTPASASDEQIWYEILYETNSIITVEWSPKPAIFVNLCNNGKACVRSSSKGVLIQIELLLCV